MRVSVYNKKNRFLQYVDLTGEAPKTLRIAELNLDLVSHLSENTRVPINPVLNVTPHYFCHDTSYGNTERYVEI